MDVTVSRRTAMQTRNPIFDELGKAMEGAMGLAQSASEEARAMMRAQADRLVVEFDLVRRDELEAVKATLMGEIAALRAEVAQSSALQQTARPTEDAG